jgi:hypothetical protein
VATLGTKMPSTGSTERLPPSVTGLLTPTPPSGRRNAGTQPRKCWIRSGDSSAQISREESVRNSLIRSLDANGGTPSSLLDLLDTMTAEADPIWTRLTDQHDKAFAKFSLFVVAPRPYGLGLTGKEDLLKHLALEHKEERAPYRRRATVDRMNAMRSRVGRLLDYEIPAATETPGGYRELDHSEGSATPFRMIKQRDHTADATLSRLKRDDPPLADRVVRGEITANAAAREKGWRKERILVTSPERVAAALRRIMPPPDLAELVKILKEDA